MVNRIIFISTKTAISEKMIPMTRKIGLARLFIMAKQVLILIAPGNNYPGEIHEESCNGNYPKDETRC